MNNHTKLLFFDIDGTLITDDGRRYFPESAKEAIRLARAAGHKTFINTGRVLVNIEDFIREAGFDGYVCGCGTHIILDGKELLHNLVPRERCVEIAEKARECRMLALFEQAEQTCYDKGIWGNEYREVLDYFISMKRKMVEDIYAPEFLFDKFATWYYDDNDRVQEFLDYISEDFDSIKREGNFYECVPKGFSKATGIRFLCERFGVTEEDCYAFGDSNNDIGMLSAVKYSVAMGNSTPGVIACAAFHTDTVENGGIKKAMEHYHLI